MAGHFPANIHGLLRESGGQDGRILWRRKGNDE
jgi:hypothetical protein